MSDIRDTEEHGGAKGDFPVARVAVIAVIVLFVLVALVVAVAFIIAQGDVTTAAPIVQIIRDVFLIFLSLQGVMIILALAILIVQLARLISLLQNEIQPILKNTQETVKTAAGTVRFVSDNVTSPLLRVSSFFAGTSVLLSNLGGIRKALRRTDPPSASVPDSKAEKGS
jgi:hypothetical protein